MALPAVPGGLQSISLGQLGAIFIDDIAEHTGDWCVITALTDATFTDLVTSTISLNGAVPGSLGGKVLGKGLSLFGRFSTIELTSGSVIAYNALSS